MVNKCVYLYQYKTFRKNSSTPDLKCEQKKVLSEKYRNEKYRNMES